MARHMFADLAWLPRTPADFGRQCRAALDSDRIGAHIQALAGYALDANQLVRLGRVLGSAHAAGQSLHPLVPFRLGVLGNGVLDVVVPALRASAARHGIALECVTTEYDQVMQAALSPESAINCARPDAVLIAIDHRALPLRITPCDPAPPAKRLPPGRPA
jgi:hypothetical protein